MAEFSVQYQQTPFRDSSPRTLLVEATDRVDAFILAVDFLTRRGLSVSIYHQPTCTTRFNEVVEGYIESDTDTKFKGAEMDRIVAAGVEKSWGHTVIREVRPYRVTKPVGEVRAF